jgi:hypothetical protein
MDDQLDNDLKKRISEVFENFDDTSADEGWLLLREKYPEKAKRRPVAWLWWGSAAALLLLFLGILWFKYTPESKQHLAISSKQPKNNSTPKILEHPKSNVLSDSAAQHRHNQAFTNNTSHTNKTFTNNTSHSKKTFTDNTSHSNKAFTDNISHTNKGIKKLPGKSNYYQSTSALNKPNDIVTNISGEFAISNPAKTQIQSTLTPKTEVKTKMDTDSKSPVKSMVVVPIPGVNMQQQVTKSNKTLFADNNNQSPKTKEKSKNDDKAVRFGVYAATYFNYAKGSSNQVNLGAGFTSDIKLSKNLKLSTGLAIAQNTLSYNNQPPQTAPANSFVAKASPLLRTFSNLYGSNLYASPFLNVSTPAFKNYNARLVGLDVPLNLKYVFNPQKSDTYISAGLSSGTFINETYTYSYNYPASFSSSATQVQNQSTRNNFNSFYFAKTLNFSFGTGYPLGHNRLIIEPFLKYPLDGLGSQQIRFGAGGLNLKFNFQSQKK